MAYRPHNHDNYNLFPTLSIGIFVSIEYISGEEPIPAWGHWDICDIVRGLYKIINLVAVPCLSNNRGV